MNKRRFGLIHDNPTIYDMKYIKRYISVCTPDELKLREARKRALQRTFIPSNLPEEERFTENKVEMIERLRKRILDQETEQSP